MLDQVTAADMKERLWNAVASRTKLPCDEEEFFSQTGVAGMAGESRRQYLRIHMRELAVLIRGEQRYAIYTKDASPKGVALLTPIQIFPAERIKLLLQKHGAMDLELRRCRRLGESCYECGTVFADGVIPPAMYKQLIYSHGRRQ